MRGYNSKRAVLWISWLEQDNDKNGDRVGSDEWKFIAGSSGNQSSRAKLGVIVIKYVKISQLNWQLLANVHLIKFKSESCTLLSIPLTLVYPHRLSHHPRCTWEESVVVSSAGNALS